MKEYSITSGTLSKWIKESHKIASKVNNGTGKIKKSVPTPYPLTDNAMKTWFTENRNNDIPIDSNMIKVKALEFSQKLGEEGFNASDGLISQMEEAKQHRSSQHKW